MNQIYSPKEETLDRDQLQQLQIERLQSTLNRAYRNVAFYGKAFDTHRVNLEKIRQVQALSQLPFTTREDLQRSYPYDMFAVPLRDIVRIHSTSGSDRPVVVGHTRNDLRSWTDCTARLLVAAGLSEHDVVHITLDYGISAGGFGFHQGAEQIGASVIPMPGMTSPAKQAAIIKDFKTTALVCSSAYAAGIATQIENLHLHREQLHLQRILFSADRCSDSLRAHLEEQLHVVSTDLYGLTEIMEPGIAGECPQRSGLHINEDHLIAEIIDPNTLEPLSPGNEGELVLTTITKEGFPLIRYRTGDITAISDAPCPCGRTFARMARVKRRTDDMILFRGVSFLPAQIVQILCATAGVSPHHQILLDREGNADTLEVRVEVSENAPALDEVKTLEKLRAQLTRRIKAVLDIDARITFAEPRSLADLSPHARVHDKRPQ